MREGGVSLAGTKRSAINPCNVDGRLLNASVEGHSAETSQADARKAAVLEHVKLLRRKADRQRRLRLLREHCRQRLQLDIAQQAIDLQEVQQRALALTQRQRLADYSKSITARNMAAPSRAYQLTLTETAGEQANSRLARSSARRRGKSASAHKSRTRAVAIPSDSSPTPKSKPMQLNASSAVEEAPMESMCTSMRSKLLPRPPPAPRPAACQAVTPLRRFSQTQLPSRQCTRLSLTGSEARRLKSSSARLSNLAWKVKELRLSLPQLCMCHQVSPLDAEYPFHCASNCQLFRNPEAHELMLRSLLQAFEIV